MYLQNPHDCDSNWMDFRELHPANPLIDEMPSGIIRPKSQFDTHEAIYRDRKGKVRNNRCWVSEARVIWGKYQSVMLMDIKSGDTVAAKGVEGMKDFVSAEWQSILDQNKE